MNTLRRAGFGVLVPTLLASTVLAGCATKSTGSDFAAGGGDTKSRGNTVTLIEQPWDDLQVENEITKQLLTKLGYTVKIDSVSVELGAQAISTGGADAYLGNWWPSQKPTYGDLIDAKKVDVVNDALVTQTEYAPAVPGDVASRLNIKSLADLKAHADEFDRKIYGIEAGSPGNETIKKAIASNAYGLKDWTLVESGTSAMLAQVEKNEKEGKPIVFLAWSPHWMTVQFKTVFLDDPDKVWGGAGAIRTVTRSGLTAAQPSVVTLLKNESFTTDEAGQFYFDKDKSGKSLPDIASAWIAANPDKVKQFATGVTSTDGKPAETVLS